jgi:hypothetical protein
MACAISALRAFSLRECASSVEQSCVAKIYVARSCRRHLI